MRTLRLGLAGAVTLGLLLSSTGAAVSQESQVVTGPENTWVTLEGQECYAGERPPGLTGGEGDGFDWSQGGRGYCEMTFSDPRVSGTLTQTVNEVWYGKYGPVILWGSEMLEGPEGVWNGWYQGLDPDLEAQLTYHVMTGSGAYEGLTFIWARQWEEPPPGGAWNGAGFIYEGNPPPLTDHIEPVE